jgi:hypothetical protein
VPYQVLKVDMYVRLVSYAVSLLAKGVDCRYMLAAFTLLCCMLLYDSRLLHSRLNVPTSVEDVRLAEVVVRSVVATFRRVTDIKLCLLALIGDNGTVTRDMHM